MFSARTTAAMAALALGAAMLTGAAQAQITNIEGAQSNYVGMGRSAKTGDCPGIGWGFLAGAASPTGYVMFNDASGISTATGTLDKATGAFHLTLTSIDGKGPTGTVDGVRGADGSLRAVLTGPGCSNVTIRHAKPTQGTDVNR